MEDKKTKDIFFNTIPHLIKEDFYSRRLSVPEKNLLLHLRMVADLFGQVHTSADTLRSDVFSNKISRGTVNDHLLSLRTLEYITYPDRKGNGGAFQLLVNQWLIKDGVWLRMISTGLKSENGGKVSNTPITAPDVYTKVDVQKRRFNEPNCVDSKGRMNEIVKAKNGGNYNDINKENQNDNDINKEKENDNENDFRKSLSNKGRDYSVARFVPSSPEETYCLWLSEVLKEKSVGFSIGIYRKYGVAPLKSAVEEFKKADIQTIDNPRAFFNHLVQQFL